MPAVANAIYDAIGVRIDESRDARQGVGKHSKANPGELGPMNFPSVPYPDPIFVLPPWESGDGKETPSAMHDLPWLTHRAPRSVAEAAKIPAGEGARDADRRRHRSVAEHEAPPSGAAGARLAAQVDELRKLNASFRRRPDPSELVHTMRPRRCATRRSRWRRRSSATWARSGQPVPRHARNYYNQTRVAKAIDFCLKKDGGILLGGYLEQTLRGGLVDRPRPRLSL